MKKHRIVIIGFAHMHINDVARSFYECPDMEIVACADTPHSESEPLHAPYTRGWNRDFCVQNFHIPRVYEDYSAMLDAEKPDLAVITCENDLHMQVVRECARRGVAVSVEKPMAMSFADAEEMARAVTDAGVAMMINWPVAWSPAYLKMKELADQQIIGRILQFRIRTAHTGPLGMGARHKGVSDTAEAMSGEEKGKTWWHRTERGGGAMLDFCCYGSILSRWMLGQEPLQVMGMCANLDSRYGNACDNAAMLVRYPDALATIEGSWTTPKEFPYTDLPVLYGTKGAMTMDPDGQNAVKVSLFGEDAPRTYAADVPRGGYSIAHAWLHKFETGEAPFALLDVPMNLSAMRLLDAGVRSAASGRMETVNNGSPSDERGLKNA